MELLPDDSALNVFRFVGHTRYWEDNVTRGLLLLITRSPSGGLLLHELLDLCSDHVSAGQPQAEAFRRAINSLSCVTVRGQTSFAMEGDDEGDFESFAVLVGLTPERPQEAPKITAAEKKAGRFDAVFSCEFPDGVFDMAIESKVSGTIGSEQWTRYREKLGGDRCLEINLEWAEVLDLLEGLPQANRNDPLVADYIDYLTDMYWLSGFRGFRPEDFEKDGATSRRARLRQLAAEIERLEHDEPAGVIGHRELRGGFDVDFYLADQFKLIGNTGVASWDESSLVVKLVIGSFAFYGDEELTQQIAEASEREQPAFKTYWGTRALLRVDKQQVADRVAQAASETRLQVGVIFRCYFNRFVDLPVHSRTWDITNSDDWGEIDDTLRLGEPTDGSRVTSSSLDRLVRFLPGGETSQMQRVRDELAARPEANPTHHAILVMSLPIAASDITSLGPAATVEMIREKHSCAARLLRDLSNLARFAQK